MRKSNLRKYLVGGAAAGAMTLALGAPAWAQQATYDFNQPSMEMAAAIQAVGHQTGANILVDSRLVSGLRSPELKGDLSTDQALVALLDGTGLIAQRTDKNSILIRRASDPQSGSAAGAGADAGTVQALIVTAQKREENIQDVPIAMSAFTQEDLTKSQVAGGPDLMTQVPNFTFTKTNFSGYSIQIRGIGTQAISATTDPAVAVAFNNTPFIRNRFFEQEFYDLERVEVLRGPQGTLYGRNATAGVVNILSAKPNLSHFDAKISADVGDYNSTRLEGMLNLPIVSDKVALRLAGAWTKRDGYDTNQITGNQIDGRNLWSARASLRFEPTDRFKANLIYEHFQEDDDRLRSGKQLCKRDDITEFEGHVVDPESGAGGGANTVSALSLGCLPASLYSPESFEAPDGYSLPYYYPLGDNAQGGIAFPTSPRDPYVSTTQSKNLRVIESTVDPHYLAKSDLAELQVSYELTDKLTLTSETGYNSDFIFSTEDYNRFNTAPGVFLDHVPPPRWPGDSGGVQNVLNNGYFCDPQVGCANRLVAVDLSTARSRQFAQEFRLASDFDGPFNFSLGANFLRYDTEDKYYVFINSLTLFSAVATTHATGTNTYYMPPYQQGVSDNTQCLRNGMVAGDPRAPQSIFGCIYIDPNPIGSLNDMGHNYFLSRNPYKLISYATFGEAYYKITPTLKLTAGLRWTVDRKEAPRIPSWLLAAETVGYPVMEVVRQEWREPTGRLALDWKPELSFTDETLLYASYAHGYKAGGSNPPPAIIATARNTFGIQESIAQPKTFGPEFVNAYELGTKNTLLDGRLTVNANAFYYDYTGYQISQIVNRSAVNYNFDAKVWGAEFEGDWRPLENLRLGLKVGYERTRVANGQQAIDVMNRTAGHTDWVAIRPFPTVPSNCIVPKYIMLTVNDVRVPHWIDSGLSAGPCVEAYLNHLDPITRLPYVFKPTIQSNLGAGTGPLDPQWAGYKGFDPSTAPNNGEGFFTDLSGHELPNAPHITTTVTADYTLPLPNNWLMTLHSDFYYQSEAWTRIFNLPGYDKLKAYYNVNLAAIFSNEDAGWQVMAYVKNVLNADNITGAFLNSDDSGLTTNVFLNEPRLYGLRVTKQWTGEPWWLSGEANHPAGQPYPFTVEIGGQVQHHDAGYRPVETAAFAAFPAAVNPAGAQNRDLDWGDGREITLTYRPASAVWSISAAARYGKTNGSARAHLEKATGPGACQLPSFFGRFAKEWCDPTYAYGDKPAGYYYKPMSVATPTEWSDSYAANKEEHVIVDFLAKRDVGLGAIPGFKSSAGIGLRYANLKSTTIANMRGVDDQYIPDGWGLYYTTTSHVHDASLRAKREFKGEGPELSWDASQRVLGDENLGHVDVDWSVKGAVLLGRQRTVISGTDSSTFYHGGFGFFPLPHSAPVVTPVAIERSKSATVNNLDLSLGLSYEVQRIKVGAGYRWERYFNAIDAGYDTRKTYDRTVDGPYFKVSVGFGG